MKKYFLILILFLPVTLAFAATKNTININQKQILHNASNLDPSALKYAVKGYEWAAKNGRMKNPDILTIVDFNKPSYRKRLWVIDLKTSKILMNTFTTHGANSGLARSERFSNKVNSHESSLGVYETMNSYHGKYGYSLRLRGLEKGINDNVFKRAIVVHPAWYATQQAIDHYGQAGRSWGCFGLPPNLDKKFVNLTRDGSILFAYAKQERSDPFITT